METLIEIAKVLAGAAFGGIVGHCYTCWLEDHLLRSRHD